MAEAMVKPQRGRSLLKSLAIVATAFLAGCQTLVPKGPPPVETTAPPPETRPPVEQGRSEAHTSELQSLMRNSYAVFCLKNKKKTRLRTTGTKCYICRIRGQHTIAKTTHRN